MSLKRGSQKLPRCCFSITWQDASVGAGHARDLGGACDFGYACNCNIGYTRGLLWVSANRVLLGWLHSRAWPARTDGCMAAILVVLAILAMPAIAILVIPAVCFGFLQIGYCLVGCSRGHGPLVQIWPARTNKTSVGAGHARDISYACREIQG